MTAVTGQLTATLVLCVALLSACTSRSTDNNGASRFTRHTIEHQGLEREYFVYLPSGYEDGAEYPVVFFLHGYGGSATGVEAETTNGLNRYAEQYGYVVVYPQGTWFMSDGSPEESWEVSSWNHISGNFDEGPAGPLCTPDADKFPCPPDCGDCGRCGWLSCHDDIGFLKLLLATVATDFKADRRRFYVSGFSNGSMMAQRIGCLASEWFAAVALVGGRVERGYQCAPSKALPLLQINGGRDETVPYDGRVSRSQYFYASAKATATAWNAGTACEEEPQPWSNALSEEHGLQCTVTCTASNRESIDCLWPDGEHFWPGYPIGFGSNGYCVSELQRESMPGQTLCVEPDTNVDVWGSSLMFDFFEAH